MAGLHPHGNSYLPNEVIAGWFGEEPENDHPIPLNDHHAEDLTDDDNSEPEVENLPPVAPIPNPNPRPTFHGPTPPWVECLEAWSEDQDQPMPFNGDRSFYNVNEGSSADKVLRIALITSERSERNHETLLQALAETRAEVIELQVRQRVYERYLLDMERQLAELRVHHRGDRHQ